MYQNPQQPQSPTPGGTTSWSGRRIIFLIIGILAVIIILAFIISAFSGKESGMMQKKGSQKPMTADEQLEAVAAIKEIFGTVKAVEPNNGGVQLMVEADVVDMEEAKKADLSKDGAELPMVRSQYQVMVANGTTVENGSVSDIAVGDFVRITASESVYADNAFNASRIAIVTKGQ